MSKGDNQARRVLVTAALPYSNGRLHVGHIVGAYLPSDIYVRFLRLRGAQVKFICGSDDHGVAIMLSAHKEGKSPAEVAEHYHGLQQAAFDGLGINFDIYSSTSRNPYHAKLSQEFFKRMHDKGFFEKRSTKQFFDDKSGVFLPDRFVKGTCGFCNAPDQNGDQCESCGRMLDPESLRDVRSVISGQPVVVRDTVHWFLDLTRFKTNVSKWLESAVLREHTRRYVSGLLDAGLVKRSMTRDLIWGVPVPLDDPDAKGKVLYVWFDAPIGYISNTMELFAGRNEYLEWWASEQSEIYHFIGEDNTVFHCLVWIAMLCAEGTYRLPRGVIVNQFMNIKFPGKDEEKISKSRGTAVWIDEYLAEGGDPDALRYYLTSIATEKAKTVYRPEDLLARQNSDLANVIGNFVNRVLSFKIKNFGREVAAPGTASDFDKAFAGLRQKTHAELTELLESFQFKSGIELVMEFARACNKYIDDTQPWSVRKSDPARAADIMAYALSAIRSLQIWLSPFMPATSRRIGIMLGLDVGQNIAELPLKQAWDDAVRDLPVGHVLGTPEILFSKL